jgi:hypothetical protein
MPTITSYTTNCDLTPGASLQGAGPGIEVAIVELRAGSSW